MYIHIHKQSLLLLLLITHQADQRSYVNRLHHHPVCTLAEEVVDVMLHRIACHTYYPAAIPHIADSLCRCGSIHIRHPVSYVLTSVIYILYISVKSRRSLHEVHQDHVDARVALSCQ